MRRTLKTLAIAALALALLNASPGLCFCSHVAAAAPSGAASHGCCRSSALSIGSHGVACCQIERAEHQAKATDAAPAVGTAPLSSAPVAIAVTIPPPTARVTAVAFDTSPPIQPLRV